MRASGFSISKTESAFEIIFPIVVATLFSATSRK